MPGERESGRTTWTVIVETSLEGVRREHLDPLRRALLANAAAVAPAASYDAEAATLTAQFLVFADDRREAALRGCFAYWGAIAAAGLAVDRESTLLVAPRDDTGDAQPFSARAHLAPA